MPADARYDLRDSMAQASSEATTTTSVSAASGNDGTYVAPTDARQDFRGSPDRATTASAQFDRLRQRLLARQQGQHCAIGSAPTTDRGERPDTSSETRRKVTDLLNAASGANTHDDDVTSHAGPASTNDGCSTHPATSGTANADLGLTAIGGAIDYHRHLDVATTDGDDECPFDLSRELASIMEQDSHTGGEFTMLTASKRPGSDLDPNGDGKRARTLSSGIIIPPLPHVSEAVLIQLEEASPPFQLPAAIQ